MVPYVTAAVYLCYVLHHTVLNIVVRKLLTLSDVFRVKELNSLEVNNGDRAERAANLVYKTRSAWKQHCGQRGLKVDVWSDACVNAQLIVAVCSSTHEILNNPRTRNPLIA